MNGNMAPITKYEDVPTMRRSSLNSFLFLVPFGGLIVIWNLLTGPIYYNKPDGRGGLKTWSRANKWAAIFILIAYPALIIYLIVAS